MDSRDLVLYTAVDLQRIFGISKDSAYRLFRTSGFPTFRVGRRYYVRRVDLEKWIMARVKKSFMF